MSSTGNGDAARPQGPSLPHERDQQNSSTNPEPDPQMRRAGEPPRHVGREAVALHHVEARRGQQHDAGGLRLRIAGSERLQHRDLAGDVDVMRPRGEAGLGHRPRRL